MQMFYMAVVSVVLAMTTSTVHKDLDASARAKDTIELRVAVGSMTVAAPDADDRAMDEGDWRAPGSDAR